MSHSIYFKNKSGATLNQKDSGLANSWSNNQTIDILSNHRGHQIFPLTKLRNLVVSGDVIAVTDGTGTTEYSVARTLEHFEGASLADLHSELESNEIAEQVANKGIANGYAELDSTGRVPSSQLPATTGGVTYHGAWDASTNTPALSSGVGTLGDMYRVSVAGSTNLDGGNSWSVGDTAIFGTSGWEQISPADSVTSVHGRTGAVVGQAGDYTAAQVGLGNVDNTSDLDKPVSTSTQILLDAKESISNKGVANGYAGLDGNGQIPNGNIGATLDTVMSNGSTSNVSTSIDIQTTSTANINSTGAMSIGGSSMSITSAGSQIESFYTNAATATTPNGAQITHAETLEVTSSSVVYDSQMTSDSLTRKEYVDTEISNAVAGASSGGFIGDIKPSLLTSAQMSAISTDWILANGGSCIGTAYATLTGNNTVPDLRGQFLRGLDTSGTVDKDGQSRTLGSSQSDATAKNGLFLNIRTTDSSSPWHERSDIISGSSPPNNSPSGNAINGDLETRPVNVAVNYFIKVN